MCQVFSYKLKRKEGGTIPPSAKADGILVPNFMSAEKCPVCRGNGLVPNGFYNQTSGMRSTCSLTPETCRSCQGKGFVIVDESKVSFYGSPKDCFDSNVECFDSEGVNPFHPTIKFQ